MNNLSRRTTVEKAAWLRPLRTEISPEYSRTRLLLAINDAEKLGFEATKEALIALLKEIESQG